MAINSGGRVNYLLNSQVRILCCDGRVSKEVYEVESDRSDRKGHVALKEVNSNRQVRVQYRRILPVNIDGQAAVIESGGKFRAVCPKCNYVEAIFPSSENFSCQVHGQFPLYWLGDKPMSEATTVTKTETPVAEHPVMDRKSDKVEKTKQVNTIDLKALAATPNCELWTRKYVKFDHPSMNVQCHTLLFTGENPRKFCFNTYNETAGKKGVTLPFDEFIKDEPVKGAKKDRPWYAVPDLEKARAKLVKDGYEKN